MRKGDRVKLKFVRVPRRSWGEGRCLRLSFLRGVCICISL